MQMIAENTRGLRLLARLNLDTLLMSGALAGALLLAAYLGQFIS